MIDDKRAGVKPSPPASVNRSLKRKKVYDLTKRKKHFKKLFKTNIDEKKTRLQRNVRQVYFLSSFTFFLPNITGFYRVFVRFLSYLGRL